MQQQTAVTLQTDIPYDVNGRLTVLVTELAEKWLSPDRSPIMRATILVITRHRQEKIVLTPHNPKASWRQYEFWYLGGRDEQVRLSIKRR
ncbi:hypothetical protein [Nevskia sp.]|uniref:hypothetical protein n=1 Tax=Nevskia sp. TaxID=1929292 RepID=UPI0025FBFC54|nr:hypothetical protein [Nevskia sp.]